MGSFEVILLDTHVWIWYLSNPELLSRPALAAVEAAKKDGRVHVSCISTWELFILVKKGRLVLTQDETAWVRRAEGLPFLTFVPVDNEIARLSVQLPAPLHEDPADRIIVATARSMGLTLITKDERLLNYSHIASVW
jgi:PIN domain nuclease of toxin-antitoxin system